MAAPRGWFMVALLSALPSCTLLYPYEVTTELCTGGIDDDLDGDVDCDDSDCEGSCVEQGADACRNHRDDDLDGFTDADDPRCWPEAANITLDRCRSILGSAFDLAHNEAFWSADHLYWYPNPSGSGRDVLGVGGRSWGRIRVIDPITGTWDGLQVRGRVHLGTPAAGERASLQVLLSDFDLQFSRLDGQDQGAIGLEDWTLFGPVPAGVDWVDLAIDVVMQGSDLVARMTLRRPGQPDIEASDTFPADWPLAPPLGLDIGLAGPALLESLTVTRPPYHTCES